MTFYTRHPAKNQFVNKILLFRRRPIFLFSCLKLSKNKIAVFEKKSPNIAGNLQIKYVIFL